MLDVVHYFFEQDNEYSSQATAETRSSVRTNMYRVFYNKEYTYGIQTESDSNGNSEDNFSGLTPVDPLNNGMTKKFIPATDIDDLSSILDGPLG